MSKMDKHPDYKSSMFHSSKSAGMIYTLDQYIDEFVNIDDISKELSDKYRKYKYYSKVELKKEIADDISAILEKNNTLFSKCNCIVPVPSHNFNYIVKLIAPIINLRYIDALQKNRSFKMKKIEPISTRKSETGFISCNYTFDADDYILLIDDFVDSGTTFRECIQSIRKTNPNVGIVCISIFRTEKTQVELE